MKTRTQEAARGLVAAFLCLSLSVRTQGDESDYTGYFSNISTQLNQKVTADARDLSEAALKNLLGDPAFLNALCQQTLLAKYGVGQFEAFAKADPSNRTFLCWLLQNTTAMDLYLLGAAPVGLAQREANNYGYGLPGGSLEIWKRIYYADPESREGLYLRLAIATGLNPPGTGNRGAGQAEKPADPVDRYKHFKSAHQNGELLPSFDYLSVWEYRQVVSSNASDADLAWGREMVNTWMPQLREGEKVVDATAHVWRRNSPIPFNNGFKSVMEGGGKCGPRSSFGVFINQAFGIPAIGVAQPGHAAVAWRTPDGMWQIGYGRGWGASRLLGLSGSEFLEGMAARSHATQFSQVEHLRWLALALASQEQAAAVLAIAHKIQKAPPAIDTIPRDWSAPRRKRVPHPEPSIPVAPGVIYVEAEALFDQGGENAFGGQYRGVPVMDCYTGGKQLHFQALMPSAWAGYKIDVPATGVYELVARVATVNSGQSLYVRSFGTMAPVKKATASTVFMEMVKDLGPQQAVDNNPGTRWAVNDGMDEAWLELDLGRPTTITTVMIDERMWNRVSKFLVEYKVGNDWKTIFEGTNIGIDFSKDFAPVTAQNVRLHILNNRQGGPTIWEFNVGTVKDGRAWINLPCTYGLWQTTTPVDIRLVKGTQTLWIFAPCQRGVSLRWFELRPKGKTP